MIVIRMTTRQCSEEEKCRELLIGCLVYTLVVLCHSSAPELRIINICCRNRNKERGGRRESWRSDLNLLVLPTFSTTSSPILFSFWRRFIYPFFSFFFFCFDESKWSKKKVWGKNMNEQFTKRNRPAIIGNIHRLPEWLCCLYFFFSFFVFYWSTCRLMIARCRLSSRRWNNRESRLVYNKKKIT